MNVLLVHPSALRYAQSYLRLEPLGLECVAQALCQHGHFVHLLDLQVSTHREFRKELRGFRPDAVGLSLNYLANVPEAIELAKLAKRRLPDAFVFTGGQAAALIADEVLTHADGAIDAVVAGDGEMLGPDLLDAFPKTDGMPGIVTLRGRGPRATQAANIDRARPARDLTTRRNRYFIGDARPCASIEFSRGRRMAAPEIIANEILDIHEPNLFIIDDAAFAYTDHVMAIADEVEQRRLRKRYHVSTRAEILLGHEDVFDRWVELGLSSIVMRLASLGDDEPRALHRRALEVATRFGLLATIELVVDPAWDRADFARAREWASTAPASIYLTVETPYPGSELFSSNERRVTSTDYRLYDARHAVMATRLSLADFYGELLRTQAIINRRHTGWRGMFTRRATKDAPRRLADHRRPTTYQLRRPERFPVQVLAATARQRMTSAVNGAT
jgi:hopanoid C-3 methylase